MGIPISFAPADRVLLDRIADALEVSAYEQHRQAEAQIGIQSELEKIRLALSGNSDSAVTLAITLEPEPI